uniref:Serine-threonine protein kinase, plant-type n=1 Tax=Solanum tuberosum TaxID=4113 RepID=M1C625_SOLTU
MLRYLEVGNNPLSGVLPNSIGNLSSTIEKNHLVDAHINGLIPTSIGNMSGLTSIDIQDNNLAGNIPSEIEGELPSDIGELKAIVGLYLYSNHFSGVIPTRFGELQNLQYLDLSNNSFFGKSPLSFANLISLVFLNLSFNALSGTIPMSLEKLSYLKSINVSFNDLEGEIPSGGVFANSTLQSFRGNKGLCGVHILDIPACDITNPGKQSKLKGVVLKIVTPLVISSFLIFLLVSIWIMKRHKKGKSKDVEKVSEIRTHQLVSYHEIQRATNNFDESNLIGEGSSGSVYKGILSSGTVVAIKVLDLENEQVCKRFDTECEVMRNIMVAHVGDFGISKILAISKSIAYTETLGTLGYIAPEYGSEGIVSSSGDVYSYGIMLMEVLTKRRPTDEEICNENLDLRKWIIQSFSGSMMDVVDANLFYEEEQITSKSEICIASMIELGLDCTKEMPESRVTMKDVVKRLNKIKNAFLET